MRRTPLAGHIRDAKVVTFGNTALDQLDRDNRLGFLLDEILQQLFDLCRSNVAVMQGSPSRNAVESPFQATHIRFDPLRNKVKDRLTQANLHGGGLLAKNGQTSLDVRRLQLCAQTPLKAGNKALLQIGDISRRAVTG